MKNETDELAGEESSRSQGPQAISRGASWSVLVFGAVVVVSLWGSTIWLLGPEEGRGTFGDMFGAVNALFSGLAFAGIIYTIYLQRSELALQRQELRDTRNEFAQQSEQFRIQSKTMLAQEFDARLTFLLNRIRQAQESFSAQIIDIRIASTVTVSGLKGLDVTRDFLKTSYELKIESSEEDEHKKLLDRRYVDEAFRLVWRFAWSDFAELNNTLALTCQQVLIHKDPDEWDTYRRIIAISVSPHLLVICKYFISTSQFEDVEAGRDIKRLGILDTIDARFLFHPFHVAYR